MNRRDLFISAISFLIGIAVMYFYNLNWVRTVRHQTENLIANFRDTYNIQRDLSLNYSNSYDLLVNCLFVEKDKCNVGEKAKEFEKIDKERMGLKSQLEQKNRETEAIMSKYP